MATVTWNDNGKKIKIHYEVVGLGEPIVFHHGNGNRINDWYTLGYVDALKNDFQLILIDSRGYGGSTKSHDPGDYSLQSRAGDTIAVMDELGVKQAHCVGASFNAAICFQLARFHPQRFKSFIVPLDG